MSDLTVERLREVLAYDSERGVFTWRVRRRGVRVGGVSGCVRRDGYRLIRVYGFLYLAHRLAWLYMTGKWPIDEVDHKNGVPGDDWFDNLREASRSGNMQNQRRAKRGNATGLLGVCRNRDKFIARIVVDGKRRHLGTFTNAEVAHAAYVEAKRTLHQTGML